MSEIKDAFLSITTKQELADVLGVKLGTLNYYCKLKQSSKCYRSFCINKKSGGVRLIFAPNEQLKYIQRTLSEILYEIYETKKIAHGFVLNRSVVTNAAVHVRNRHVLNLDIENFFNSIHFGRVRGIFESKPFNFNSEISLALAQLVCFSGALPQGAPTSPILSNFICRSLDNDLIRLCSKYKCVCTRYCDDITISTKSRSLPGEISYTENNQIKIGTELLNIFKQHNFDLNYDKIRLQSNNLRKMVTGIVVNEKTNILKNKYRKLRAIMHYTYYNGVEEGAKKNNFVTETGQANTQKFEAYLAGMINYYKMVTTSGSSKYKYLAQKFNEIFGERFSIPCDFDESALRNIYIIEGKEPQGTAFLLKGVGLVTCLHNVCEIAKEIETKELERIINEDIKVYLPSNPNRMSLISLKEYFWTEDLLILNIEGRAASDGFELVDKFELPVIGRDSFTAMGYSNYAPERTIDILRDIRVRSKKTLYGQDLYIADSQFLTGSSGGPVFNEENKVIGYIDRGDKNTAESKIESAFCLLTPILMSKK